MHDDTPLTDVLAIRLDGRPHQVPAGSTLAALVQALGHAPDAVATALNGDFVPRGQRAALELRTGDAVLFFQPITGG
ncbi:sulfur carrier protein ThiS [Xylophilus sp. ASV27]|uniref:sulfur carrier protein ThiS n=1 Tax=Xylophilus sp. ASV27 TaxID=2795129 RepID=UPI0018EBED11|nr:sulfur carrier protein ThiS [Xylophilus sp. ASV27]